MAAEKSRVSLFVPTGWQAEAEPSGMVTVKGPDAQEVVIWPFFVPEALDDGSAGAVLSRFASQVWPDVAWGPAATADPGTMKMQGPIATGLLTWAGSPQGTAGCAYFTKADAEEVYRQSTGTFAHILESVRIAGDAEPAFDRWQDPKEQAFSLEVPRGWQVQGGSVRPSPLLVQAEVGVTSPDGQIHLWMGDHFPLFVEPNPMMMFMGATYTDPMGYSWPVQPYAPGADFISRHFLPRRHQQFEVTGWRALPDLAATCRSYGMNRFDAGQVAYRFASGGEWWQGNMVAITEVLDAGSGNRSWHLWRGYLWEAPEARAAEAETALSRVAETLRVNPLWAQMQAGLTAAQSRILTDMNNHISHIIHSAYEYRQRVDDEISRRRSNAILGVVDVIDPVTGRAYRVENSSNYYWIDHQGYIVGTQTHSLPNLDFRALTTLP